MNVERRDLVCVALIFWFQFQDDPILVIRRKNRRDLALPISGVDLVLDLIHSDSIRGRCVAVDLDVDLRISYLEIAAYVREARERAHLGREILSRRVKLVRIWALYGELVERFALQAADADRGIIAQERHHAGHGSEFGAQLVDDLVALRALRPRLQANVEPALIQGSAARADR